jgi:AraC-like DNA-binding protein
VDSDRDSSGRATAFAIIRATPSRAVGASAASERNAGSAATSAGVRDYIRSDKTVVVGAVEVRESTSMNDASRVELDSSALALPQRIDTQEHSKTFGEVHAAGSRPRIDDWRIRRTLEHIDQHLREELTLKALAARMRLSISHFSALFRASVGCSPHRWVLERRIRHAMALLENEPRRSVTDVALSCGFGTLQHFSTAFRHRVGCTPGAYRRSRLR